VTELRLFVDPAVPLKFVPSRTAPAAAPDARPWLTKLGRLSLRARSGSVRGDFSNETATLTVTLDNRKRQASTLLRQPLRARGEVWIDDALYFGGLVQSIDYGPTLALTIEA